MSEEESNADLGNEAYEYDEYGEEDIDEEQKGIMPSKQVFKKIVVDLWKTKLHSATIGIRQQDQYRAQSRQFTANMDVTGDVEFFSYDPNDSHLPYKKRKLVKSDYKEVVAINKAFYDVEDPKSTIRERAAKYPEYDEKKLAKQFQRIVLKLFTELEKKEGEAQAGKWRGTIEESQLMSLSLTFGEKDPLPFFFAVLPGYDYRVSVFRTHAVTGERYVFSIPNPTNGEVLTFYIEGTRFTPGSDYKVINPETNDVVAIIDDRANDIGGKVEIIFSDGDEYEELARSLVFRHILILFALLSKFLAVTCDKYKDIYKDLREQEKYFDKLKKLSEKEEKLKEDIYDIKEKQPTDAEAKIAKLEKELEKAKNERLSTKNEITAAMKNGKVLRSLFVFNEELTLHYNPRRVRS